LTALLLHQGMTKGLTSMYGSLEGHQVLQFLEKLPNLFGGFSLLFSFSAFAPATAIFRI